jgi:hypothetical protein
MVAEAIAGVVCTEVGRSVGARVAACGSVHSLLGHFAVTRSQAVLFYGGLYFLPSTSIRCVMQFYTHAAEYSNLVLVRKRITANKPAISFQVNPDVQASALCRSGRLDVPHRMINSHRAVPSQTARTHCYVEHMCSY